MKLSKERRREQLLDVAMAIVRDRGADELTLATLASDAGVSRPIAYDHFETRGGLLLALFRRVQDRQVEALREVLATAPADLRSLADVMSSAYFACYGDLDTDALAISAALRGSEQLAAQQRVVLDQYIDVMGDALRPYSPAGRKELRLRCAGLLGAAEALARECRDRRASPAAAVRTLSSLIVAGSDGGP
jgi:AcrR family transcriptional regulator